jgi:hypothetical protein
VAFYSRVERFAGRRVEDYDGRARPGARRVADPAAVAWRVCWEYAGGPAEFAAELDRFVAEFGAVATALVIGEWGGANQHPPPVGVLAERAAGLPNLRALFIGDITIDECEVSWLQTADPAPLLAAYPGLAHLRVRGSTGFSPVVHAGLRELSGSASMGNHTATRNPMSECVVSAFSGRLNASRIGG